MHQQYLIALEEIQDVVSTMATFWLEPFTTHDLHCRSPVWLSIALEIKKGVLPGTTDAVRSSRMPFTYAGKVTS